MDVNIEKFERLINNYGEIEVFYKVRKIPGGRVLNTFFVPVGNENLEAAEQKVIADIHDYLEANDLQAINKF